MRGLVGMLLATTVGFSLALGCSDDRERPGGVDPCAGQTDACIEPGQSGESSGGANAGGAGNSSAAGAAGAAGALRGVVVAYTDDQFLYVSPFAGTAEVFSDGPDGEMVSAAYDGVHPFTLAGVLATEHGWVGVQPTDPASDLLPTLHPADTTSNAEVELPLARASVVDLVLQLGTATLVRDQNAAQLVLRFVDDTGAALPGISVDTSEPEQPVLFRDGSTWSDTDTETLADGLALLPNVPAFDLPGGTIPVTCDDGVDTFVLRPRVARGAVTVMTVAVAF